MEFGCCESDVHANALIHAIGDEERVVGCEQDSRRVVERRHHRRTIVTLMSMVGFAELSVACLLACLFASSGLITNSSSSNSIAMLQRQLDENPMVNS